MKAPSKGLKRIILATVSVVFSLAVSVTGTYAWFLSNRSFLASAEHFTVSSLDASVDSVTLYKFNYKPDGHGSYDYLFPEEGWVGAYAYDDRADRNCFGEMVYNEEAGQNEWQPVTTMNLYDPLNGFITGRGLIGLNCNAIFKIVLSSSMFTNTTVSVDVRASSIQSSKSKKADEIWLSSCVDFDLFLPSSLSDPRLFGANGYKNYLPSESDLYLPQNTVFDEAYEEDYYKISYLASLNASHSHLYGSADSSVSIGTPSLTFVNGYATLYVNVNYAPSQLKSYEETVTADKSIKAIYDFLLSIS